MQITNDNLQVKTRVVIYNIESTIITTITIYKNFHLQITIVQLLFKKLLITHIHITTYNVIYNL